MPEETETAVASPEQELDSQGLAERIKRVSATFTVEEMAEAARQLNGFFPSLRDYTDALTR